MVLLDRIENINNDLEQIPVHDLTAVVYEYYVGGATRPQAEAVLQAPPFNMDAGEIVEIGVWLDELDSQSPALQKLVYVVRSMNLMMALANRELTAIDKAYVKAALNI